MKLLLDNNLSLKLTAALQPYFPDSKHVIDLGISHFDDKKIWDFAKENQYSIITKDKDFYYLATTIGHPPKIIWITLGNCRNNAILNFILKSVDKINEFLIDNRDILIFG